MDAAEQLAGQQLGLGRRAEAAGGTNHGARNARAAEVDERGGLKGAGEHDRRVIAARNLQHLTLAQPQLTHLAWAHFVRLTAVPKLPHTASAEREYTAVLELQATAAASDPSAFAASIGGLRMRMRRMRR